MPIRKIELFTWLWDDGRTPETTWLGGKQFPYGREVVTELLGEVLESYKLEILDQQEVGKWPNPEGKWHSYMKDTYIFRSNSGILFQNVQEVEHCTKWDKDNQLITFPGALAAEQWVALRV
jgi:hypothetical protein